MAPTISDLISAAHAGLDDLQALGEEVEDEWTYVTDLADAWHARFDDVTARRSDEQASAEAGAAIERLVEEARSITDPHRAIDWLSTFPQAVLVALRERP